MEAPSIFGERPRAAGRENSVAGEVALGAEPAAGAEGRGSPAGVLLGLSITITDEHYIVVKRNERTLAVTGQLLRDSLSCRTQVGAAPDSHESPDDYLL
jgi:hypothetical protein